MDCSIADETNVCEEKTCPARFGRAGFSLVIC